jgi:uncharacterized protein DUF6152
MSVVADSLEGHGVDSLLLEDFSSVSGLESRCWNRVVAESVSGNVEIIRAVRRKSVQHILAGKRGHLSFANRYSPLAEVAMMKIRLFDKPRRTRGAPARLVVVCIAAMVSGAGLLWAHHGLAAFDTTHTVRMEGTVTGIEWINPHAFVYADLKDDKGKVANWKLELGSLGMLTKYGGWTETTVKKGDHVTVQGFLAKDGSPYMSLGRIWLPDGRSLEGKP